MLAQTNSYRYFRILERGELNSMNRFSISAVAAFLLLSLTSQSQAQESKPAAPVQVTSVRFKKKALAVGDSQSEKGSIHMVNKMVITMPGAPPQTLNQTVTETESAEKTILAVDAKGASKVRVKILDNSKTDDRGAAGKNKKTHPAVGKTIVLEQKGEDVQVTDEAGKAIEPRIADAIRLEYGNELGTQHDQFFKAMPDREIKIGEIIKLSEKQANEIFNKGKKDDEAVAKNFTLTLHALKTVNGVKVAVFKSAIKMVVTPSPGLDLTMDMKGEIHLGVDTCWPYLIDMKGPLTVDGAMKRQGDATLIFKGGGTFHMKRSATYGAKRPVSGEQKAPK
jgi:hypothetical protein